MNMLIYQPEVVKRFFILYDFVTPDKVLRYLSLFNSGEIRQSLWYSFSALRVCNDYWNNILYFQGVVMMRVY